MKLASLDVRNTPPVRLFAVTDLQDIVVIAGPNGVGKSRLLQRLLDHLRGAVRNPEINGTIEATCTEEAVAWSKNILDMSTDADMNLFRQMLQVSRRRQNWRSSLLMFESDRTIQNIQPLIFSFDMPNPSEEEIGWDQTFNFLKARYQDTVHSMFRMIEAQKQGIASQAIKLQRQGRKEMSLNFQDPMTPFKRVFSRLLAPKELVDPSPAQQQLQYTFEGDVLPVSSLSSGEREVMTIAFDFLLRSPRDCIVMFDEPELHLHPELSYRLIQTLQEIGDNNQFILSTHSPDVISSSLDRSVLFIAPPSKGADGEDANQAIPVSESDETNQALRLLGQSIGIIALGKRIVLIEGDQSSLDKQTYGSIIRNEWPSIVLVPSGGKHVIESFASIYDAVLSKTIWGVDFLMLCDGDSAPTAPADRAIAATEAGRLRVLPRYHLENYFLDERVWVEVFTPMEQPGSWLTSEVKIRECMRDVARDLVSYSVSLAVASALRLRFGEVGVMPKMCHGKSVEELSRVPRRGVSNGSTG